MTTSAPPSFNRAWQAAVPTFGVEQITELLEQQLQSPSFAVPVAHPHKAGAIAYAQALYLPSSAFPVPSHQTTHACVQALDNLKSSGRLLGVFFPSDPGGSDNDIEQRYGFFLILAIRPDDPTCVATGTPTL